MSSYQPLQWKSLQLPAQTGGLRLTGPIPLNIANQIKVAAPEQISVVAEDKLNFIYPVALAMRRMDYEVLRLQSTFQKNKATSSDLRDPCHFILRLKMPDGTIHEASVEDIAKPPIKAVAEAAKTASPFELDMGYAYQGVTVSEWEIERARAGAQATTREYIFDLHAYFPRVEFSVGPFEVQVETLGLASNWAVTRIEA